MIPFIPNTAWTITTMLLLFLVCAAAAWRDRALWPLVAVMLLNWVGTRLVSSLELTGFTQGFLDIASALALMLLRHKRAMVFLPAGALFLVMVNFSLLHDLGIINRDTLWAWSDLAGYGQLIIIAGGAAAGGGGRRLGLDRNRRAGASGVGHFLAFGPETKSHS